MTSQLQEFLRKQENKYFYVKWNSPRKWKVENDWFGKSIFNEVKDLMTEFNKFFGIDWSKEEPSFQIPIIIKQQGSSKSKVNRGIELQSIQMDEIAPIIYIDSLTSAAELMLNKETNKIKKEKKSMFPTSGTIWQWKTTDGRLIHVYDLAPAHVANILQQLYDVGCRNLGIDQNKLGEYTARTLHKYLNDNCKTWPVLKQRAEVLNFISSLDGYTLTPTMKNALAYKPVKISNDEIKYPISTTKPTLGQIANSFLLIELNATEANYLIHRILDRVRK